MSIRRDTVLRRLVTARDLISDKDHWIQGDEAAASKFSGSHESDQWSTPGDKDAKAFCAIGAVKHVTYQDLRRTGSKEHEGEMYRRLVSNLPKTHRPDQNEFDLGAASSVEASFLSDFLVNMNDEGDPYAHRRVVSTFNRAIRELEDELGYVRS